MLRHGFWPRCSFIAFLLAALLDLPLGICQGADRDADQLRTEAATALRRAVAFFDQQVARHGGYVYRYSADLQKREGEGIAGPDVVWVQPPGTPAVGLALLEAYERTRDPDLLVAAKHAGECLVQGQLRSGGWSSAIDLSEAGKKKYAYRLNPARPKPGDNWTTFDDNKTQAALTFLIHLDRVLEFRDLRIHEAAQFALESVLKAQYPNGAWPQGYQEFPEASRYPVIPATFPDEWRREFPKQDYRLFYTFNDNAIADTIEMLFLAANVYQEPRYREAALQGGAFILLAQLPEPQPAWAQQYDFAMHPVWARKFEPPAVSGGESQGILRVLLRLYIESGDRKFLEPIPRAVAYLKRSRLPDGKLARFYELKTNQPLYFTKDYHLTTDDRDLPTHYGFKLSDNLARIESDWERLSQLSGTALATQRRPATFGRPNRPGDKAVRSVIGALDERGAWVEEGKLQYHGDDDPTRQVIDTVTFIRNVRLLANFLAKPD